MIIKIFCLAILTEALVQLFFTAAPMQGIRYWLIKKSPWLYSEEQGHLLSCKYCTSVWIAALVIAFAMLADCTLARLIAAAILVARLSNYAHILIGSVRDVQINMRIRR